MYKYISYVLTTIFIINFIYKNIFLYISYIIFLYIYLYIIFVYQNSYFQNMPLVVTTPCPWAVTPVRPVTPPLACRTTWHTAPTTAPLPVSSSISHPTRYCQYSMYHHGGRTEITSLSRDVNIQYGRYT